MTDRPNPPTTGSVPPNAPVQSPVPASPAGASVVPAGASAGASVAPGMSKVPSGVHSMRRGGARREVTERVTFKTEDGKVLDGWALNVSRGGLRAILEDKVTLGQKFEIALGTDDDTLLHRSGRVVWVQEEPDGVIVGIEFSGMSGPHRSVPPPPPGSQSEPKFAAEVAAAAAAEAAEADSSPDVGDEK